MSNIIRNYRGINKNCGVEVRAFMGGNEYGKAISLRFYGTDDYVELSEKQVIDLIITLLKRLGFKQGYCATDTSKFESEDRIVKPNGEIIVEEAD